MERVLSAERRLGMILSGGGRDEMVGEGLLIPGWGAWILL